MDKQTLKTLLEKAYAHGFSASTEGYNAEYPFGDQDKKPEEDPTWLSVRDDLIAQLIESQPGAIQQQLAAS